MSRKIVLIVAAFLIPLYVLLVVHFFQLFYIKRTLDEIKPAIMKINRESEPENSDLYLVNKRK